MNNNLELRVNNPEFLNHNMPGLLDRFELSFQKDCSCIEYFLYSKEKHTEISRTLIVSHEIFSKSLYISKFYPEIYKEINCRYLSAACFYMMTHHAVKEFDLYDLCDVNLETDTAVFDSFYSKLNNFDFKIKYNRVAGRVCLKGQYHKFAFSTDMITHHRI